MIIKTNKDTNVNITPVQQGRENKFLYNSVLDKNGSSTESKTSNLNKTLTKLDRNVISLRKYLIF